MKRNPKYAYKRADIRNKGAEKSERSLNALISKALEEGIIIKPLRK